MVDAEVPPGSPGGARAATDATANGDLGAVSPGPPPASPASGGSLDTASMSSEETPELGPGRDSASPAQVTSVTASVSSEETPEPVSDPESLSPAQGTSAAAAEPGGDSGALGGPEGIATSLASLILSEAIAQATGTDRAGDSEATAVPPSPSSAVPCPELGAEEVAPQRPREPCQLGGDRGQRGDTEDSAEVAEVEPQVSETQVGKVLGWERGRRTGGSPVWGHPGGMWGQSHLVGHSLLQVGLDLPLPAASGPGSGPFPSASQTQEDEMGGLGGARSLLGGV